MIYTLCYSYAIYHRRFGFANLESMEAGQTGTDCRGEEHDVTIVWSITSGKRVVLADGKEVHFSHSRNNVFDFSWTMRGNHVLKVVAHAQPPMSAAPGFRQYDFFVDGQSFFTFPKVFRLGLAPNDPRGGGRSGSGGQGQRSQQQQQQQNMNMAERSVVPTEYNNGYNNYTGGPGADRSNMTPYANAPTTNGGGGGGGGRSVNSNNIVSIEAPHNPEEEDAYLKQAIENSMRENASPNQKNRPSVTNSYGGTAPPAPSQADTLLLDFMAPPPMATGQAPGQAPGQAQLALPPSTSSYASEIFGISTPVAQQQQPPSFAALPPSTTDPNASFPPQQQQQLQLQQQQQDPWGMSSVAAALPPSQQPSSDNPYGGVAAYGGGPPQTPAPVASSDPFGGTDYSPTPFGSPPPSSIAGPPQEEYTPATQASSIGFASPMMTQAHQGQYQQQQQQQFAEPQQLDQQQPNNELFGFGEQQTTEAVDISNVEEAAAPPSDPALFSMNVLSGQPQSLVTESMKSGGTGQSKSMADQAYAKLVNMDAFDLVQEKDTESRKNPFDMTSAPSTTIGGGNSIGFGGGNNNANASLADMMKKKKPTEKKDIMKSFAPPPAAPGALVLSNNQQGNFGGYGGQPQYNMGGGGMGMMGQPQMGQPQAPAPQMQGYGGPQQMNGGMMGQSQMGQPQAPAPQMQQYGQQQMNGSMMGQPQAPAPQMQYGQQQMNGGMMQQAAPPTQQQQYGQPPQQQQQQYGQPQQQPFGF